MTAEAPGAGEWSLQDAISSMDQWDVGPMRAWLEARLCNGDLGVAVADFAALESASWWNSDAHRDPGALAVGIVASASAVPETVSPLLLYLRYVCMAAWEESWTVDSVLKLIADVGGWVTEYGADKSDALTVEVRAANELLSFLADEINVFATGIAGGLKDWAGAARTAAEKASLLGSRESSPDQSACLAYVTACLTREAGYYRRVHGAVAAVSAIHRGTTVPQDALDEAIESLADMPDGLDRADRSELRAHGASLKAIRQRLADEWLVVAAGRVSIIFPFGISEMPDSEVVDWVQRKAMTWRLADLPVVSMSNHLPISDAWDSSDPLNRAFRGAAMRLPEVDLTQPDGTLRQRMHPSIWLSDLGNHLLRLDFNLVNADPMDLYESVRIASPEFFGAARLGYALRPIFDDLGDERWDSLGEFAGRCVSSLIENLCGGVYRPIAHFAPQGFSVMALVDEAEAWCPTAGTSRALESADELIGLFGSQILTSAIWSNLASVAQWSQVAANVIPIKVPSLGAFSGTMTRNSSMVAGFGGPSYTLDLLADCFVFAASIDALFGTWYGELARMNNRSEGTLSDIALRMTSGGNPLTSDEVRSAEATLEDAQVQLHDFVVRCRSILLFVESPTLVQFAPLRTLLDLLLESSGFSARKASFLESTQAMTEGRLESVLGRLRSRILEEEVQRRNVYERRARLAVDALLAGVAVAGLSGLASLVQAGYQLGALPTGLLVLAVVLASVVIGVGVWRMNWRSS